MREQQLKNNSDSLTKLIHLSAIGADARSDIPYQRTKGLGELAIRDVLNGDSSNASTDAKWTDEVVSAEPAAFILRPGLVLGRDDQFLNVWRDGDNGVVGVCFNSFFRYISRKKLIGFRLTLFWRFRSDFTC